MKICFAFFLDRRKFGGQAKVQKKSAFKNVLLILLKKNLLRLIDHGGTEGTKRHGEELF
jgi:hypothetical protein